MLTGWIGEASRVCLGRCGRDFRQERRSRIEIEIDRVHASTIIKPVGTIGIVAAGHGGYDPPLAWAKTQKLRAAQACHGLREILEGASWPMQSSTAIAIRALVMLIVLISVPLVAIFGKSLPDVLKGLLEGRTLVL